MTYEKFLKAVKVLVDEDTKYSYGQLRLKDDKIVIKWVSGGMCGGNCWGDEPYPREPEQEPSNVILDEILKLVKPNISFLEFRELERNAIEKGGLGTDEDSESEWYGNYTDYSAKSIDLKKLHEALKL